MATITEPGYAVLSGPLVRRSDCVRALEGVGFTVLPGPPLPEDPTERQPPHRGLPSYRTPVEALEAGVPNAGHTPGTPHPDTEEAYQGDPRIAFVDVQIPDLEDALDRIAELADGARFTLRAHYPEQVITIPDLTIEQRLAQIEAHQAAIKAELRGGRR